MKEGDAVKAYHLMEGNILANPYQNLCIIMDGSGSIHPEAYKSIAETTETILDQGLEHDKKENYAIINFSFKTLYTGWFPKEKWKTERKNDKSEVKNIIRLYQQEGSTLNLETIKKLTSEGKRFGTIMVTDGITNPDVSFPSIVDTLTSNGNKLSMILMGDDWRSYKDGFRTIINLIDLYHAGSANKVSTADNATKLMKDYAAYLRGEAVKPFYG